MSDLHALIGTDISSSIEQIKTDLTTKIKPALDGHLKISIGIDAKSIEKQINDINVKAAKVKQPKVSVVNEDAVKKVGQQVEILYSRIERAKVSWSKMLGDPEIMSQVNSIQEALKDVGGDPKKYQDLNRQWQLLSNNIAVAELNTKSFGAQISQTFSRLSAYLVNVALIGTVTSGFRTALKDLRDIDDDLTQLSKVTPLVRENFKEAGLEALKAASAWGKSASDYLSATEAFAKAGKENYEQLAEVSILAQAAGDINAELANQYLITSDAAFQLGGNVDELTSLLDSQNQVTNRNAVTMEGLAEATKVYANTANVAGESTQTMTALLATGIGATQKSGEEVGRAYKYRSSNVNPEAQGCAA